MYKSIVKPFFDFSIAFLGFVILSPVFLAVTFLLFIANNGKPFFFQLRPGKNGNIFKIVKFKTMNDKKDKKGNLLSDAERLTKVGSFVRKTSLDEIPQLLNVIKGEMSLIGPRPLLPSYLEIYSDFENRRHEVKPGITGWAQVNGRNTISWDEKFEYDVWYVDHVSVVLDLKILFITIKKVLIREGISNNDGHISMPAFTEYYEEKNKKP
ncbi:sugar transferase [Flavobacterium luteum]|uniref:Sugar transferase n=1 Tax=Flavobacterium luteum TaxID=2026654 RepID=A0A7J5AEC5_9FLAO|nr:sugar transferase [Flavobacterium luteum]KAB1155843.1 sugar transferase [Flavobacterium luteum]